MFNKCTISSLFYFSSTTPFNLLLLLDDDHFRIFFSCIKVIDLVQKMWGASIKISSFSLKKFAFLSLAIFWALGRDKGNIPTTLCELTHAMT